MKRLMLQFVVLLTAILLGGSVTAQPGGQPQAPSPIVNKDNTVTFNYQSKTAKNQPQDVNQAGHCTTLIYNFLSKRPDYQARRLKALHADGNSDYRYAPKQADYKPAKCGYKSAEKEPDNVA